MKRKFFFSLFLLICCLSVFSLGCSNNLDSKEYTNLEIAHQWVKKNVSRKVVDQLDLPTTCPDVEKSEIKWSSSDPKVIDNTGKVVSRPSETKRVELTYTITVKKVSKEYVIGVYVSANTLSEVEAEFLALIPEEITESIAFPNVYAGGAVEVLLDSSHEDILKISGQFIQPFEDTEVTLTYVITDGNDEISGSVKTLAKAKGENERIAKTIEWLNLEGFNELLLSHDTVFPSQYEKEGTKIYWKSSNLNLVSNGNVVQSVFKRHVTMTATIVADNESTEVQYFCDVAPLDTSTMSEAEILEKYVAATAVDKYYQLTFNQSKDKCYCLEPYEYYNITQSYGFINFFGTIAYSFHENWLSPSMDSRPGNNHPGGLQYITIHDTAGTGSTSDAKANSAWCNSPSNNNASWHYTVDQSSIYQQIPDNEVGWHAGDGTQRLFGMIDTGIKATSTLPVVRLQGGYYYINGLKTSITPFVLDSKNSSIEHSVAIDAELNQQGLLCEIGENGNYMLGKTYYNSTYKLIANYGGNNNSIGIESCVNDGSDYATTARVLACLVAELMIKYDLEINRVRGHHYFSGKPCPNAILLADWWSEFLDLVAMEKYAQENFGDYKFSWTPGNNLITNTGKIAKTAKAGDEVKYSVKITKGSETVFEKSYTTVLA